MKTVPAALRAHLDQSVTAMCTCWLITRQDGQILRFTDADADVVQDGDTYKAVGAYKRTAIETTATLSVDNLDVVGMANELSLSDSDLRTGLYDNAEIKVFMTSWLAPVEGVLKLRRGFFGEVQTLPNGTFKVELRGILQRLSHNYTNIFSATCLYDLGDAGCTVPIKPDEIARSTAYALGNNVNVQQDGTRRGVGYPLPIVDPDFEAAATTLNFDASFGWVNTGANPVIATTAEQFTGTTSAQGGAGDGTLTQYIDILSIDGLTSAAIDAGSTYLTIRGWRRDADTDEGRFEVKFLDKDSVDISTGLDTGLADVGTTWVEVGAQDILIPVGTVYISINFHVRLVVGLTVESFMDNLSGYIIDTSQTGTLLCNTLGDVYWQCTKAGTTDPTVPVYSGGDTAFVGTVTLTDPTAMVLNWSLVVNDGVNSVTLTAKTAAPGDLEFLVGVSADADGASLAAAVHALSLRVTPIQVKARHDTDTDVVTITNMLGAGGSLDDSLGTVDASVTTVDFVGGGLNVTVDGTSEWTAFDAWTRHGRVLTTGGNRTFTAEVTDARAVTSWFNEGVVTFDTGANAGASMEVKSWDATTKQIELFLSMPSNVQVGDLFCVYPGCDKSRISCAVIFDNAVNAFMTPDIPGQDELYRTPIV